MIIGAVRHKVSSKGPHALIKHVFHGRDNEEITILRGGQYAVRAAFDDAQAAGRTYSNRHFSVSPEQAVSRDEAQAVFRSIADEFGFDLADAIVVEHHKVRQDGQGYERHWHIIVPETKPDGTALDSRFMRPRQEKLGRLAEIRLGHPITHGKHDKSVLAALEREGRPEAQAFAEVLRWREFGPGAGEPRAAYSADTHQILKRNGLKTPAIKAAIVSAWQARDEENTLTFIDRLHHLGIVLVPGRRAGAWVAAVGGVEITALHRLLKIKSSDVEAEMAAQKKRQAPAWARAQGGYDALSPRDRAKAERAFEAFRSDYETARGNAYPRDIRNYVSYVQEQEAARNPTPAAPTAKPQAAQTPTEPAQPTPLPLPDDAAALRRTIGESPHPAASRDPARIAEAYTAKVDVERAKAAARIERAEAAIERTKPSDIIKDGPLAGKMADVLARAAIGIANLILRPLGIPINYQPSFGAPRVTGQRPGDPRTHEAAHRELEKLQAFTDRLPTPEAITEKALEVAASRQAEHDAWADRTAPARLKLAEIEAREKAEREEAERRQKAEEARLAAEAAREERVEVPEFEGPERTLDDMEFEQAMEAGGEIDQLTF